MARTLDRDIDEARARLDRLAGLGVDLAAITQQLLDDGVAAFARSFDALLASIEEKCDRLQGDG